MFLTVLYKEIQEIVSSKVIITGVLLNANTIKTVGIDRKWRKWYLWYQRNRISDYFPYSLWNI
jgi:hypothetical protein